MKSAAADALKIGGVQPFSSIDCPGALAAVVFVQGCPWRCLYCHNPQLQPRDASLARWTWAAVMALLHERRGRLDAVVFSGGEPTLDPALPAALAEARASGFRTGLHTAGMAPRRLAALLPLIDWVGLDIKAPLADDALHATITGRRGASAAVRRSLALLQASGVAYECRTTAHPALLDDAVLCTLADELAAAGVPRHALQIARPTATLPAAHGTGPYPAAVTLAHWRGRIPIVELRSGQAAAA